MFKNLVLIVCTAVAGIGCSGGNDPSADAGTGTAQEACAEGFLPLKMGLKWVYEVRDLRGGGAEMKETTVDAFETVTMKPGQMAFRLRTRKGGALADETVSWQQRVNNVIARYQEQSYAPAQGGTAAQPTLLEWWDPYKLRIDETKLRKGETWMLTYKEFSRTGMVDDVPHDRNESWEVVGVNEPINNSAGSFKTLHLRRRGVDQNATSDKHYWFACGVGKIRETTIGGRSEELVRLEGK